MTEETAGAKPKPTSANPGTTGHSDKFVAVCEDSQKSPSAMSAKPPASIQRGLTRGRSRIVSGPGNGQAVEQQEAIEVFSGENPWIDDSRTLVA